jgi:hypothetical protein
MFKKTALVAGVGLALSVTAQADYQWELGGDYTMSEFSADVKTRSGQKIESDDLDADIARLYGTWYLETVDTSKGPLSEAAFLDHASNITIFGSDGEVDLSSLDDRLNDEDGQTFGFSSRYVAEGPGWKLSGWLVDLGFERAEPGDAEIDTYNLGIGNYITPNTTLVLNYGNTSINNGGDSDAYSLEHMWLMDNGGFKARASYGVNTVKNADDIDTYRVGGTWYFTNNLGVGADYLNTGQDGYEVQGWQVNSEWFFTESFAMNLAYSQLDPDDIDFTRGNFDGKVELENEAITLGAVLRF